MRLILYFINKLILIIPVTVLCSISYMYIDIASILNQPDLDGYAKDNGLLVFVIFSYALCIPLGIYIILTEHTLKFILYSIFVVLLVIGMYVLLETIYMYITKQSLRKGITNKEIVSKDNTKATFLQILLRTSIKYLTISFMPYMFLYYFVSKEHIMFHDLVAKTKLGTVEG